MLAIACLVFPARSYAYSFAFAGLYNKIQVTSMSDNRVITTVAQATEDFITELADASKSIEVFDLTPDVTLQRHNEIKLQLEHCETPAELKDVATDYIVYGSVSSLGTGTSGQGLIIVHGVSNTVRVDMSVRIIERKTGKNVFTATGRGEGQVKNFGLGASASSAELARCGETKFPLEAYNKAVTAAMVEAAGRIKKAM